MKIALVHDFLIQNGGAERVLQTFRDIWPKAPVFTLLHDPKQFGNSLRGDIRTSFLQKIPFSRRHYKWLMPLMPAATENFKLENFDLVLSSTSAFVKGVITKPETLHICYCHTPTRYLWSDTHSYVEETKLPRPINTLIPLLLSGLRTWDRTAADRVDKFIANSETVRQRITKYYRHDSHVIYPPVETKNFSISSKIGDYYLAGGRLVAYKRYDIVVRAFNKLGIPLKIFGTGPEADRLQRVANRNIEFLGRVNDREKSELFSRAIAYIHPQEEDFGITAVESMAAGRPVIAFNRGGALETVQEGITGTFIQEQTWEELVNCIIRFQPENFIPKNIRQHAEKFDTDIFRRQIKNYIKETWREYSSTYSEQKEDWTNLFTETADFNLNLSRK